MNDISILYIPDSETKEKITPVLINWATRGYLKKFLLVNKIDINSTYVSCEEFIDGNVESLDSLQKRLSSEKLDLIRFINITKPGSTNVDSDFDFFKN